MIAKIAKFVDRTEAGQLLATKLKAYANSSDVIVLGLPRGGISVAFEVAKALHLPLDICLVRKLGVPGHKELAMGAIASDGVRVLNYDIVCDLGISSQKIDEVAASELRELQRRVKRSYPEGNRAYRGDRPLPNLKNRTVILVDDGIATGASIRAAIAVLRAEQPQSIIVAIPVAPSSTCEELKAEVDQVVCLMMPEPLYGIALWYDCFPQTTDEEVSKLLSIKTMGL
ncbi:MAG: phosphoribosyltransferase [Hydrococcus sp. SU_1_0]|nr:phosphoribosyltransferase [Hydrococcus sp. SU_1_0]